MKTLEQKTQTVECESVCSKECPYNHHIPRSEARKIGPNTVCKAYYENWFYMQED